eukprot:gene7600-5461_t
MQAEGVEATSPPPRSEENCNRIRFFDLCVLFEKLSKTKGAEKKLSLIFSKSLKEHLKGDSVYPLLRLLLPAIDTERGKYGLKQAMIANTYVSALHLDKKSEDAVRLLNWKDPSKTQGVELSKLITGEFGTLLEDVLKPRVRSEPSDQTIGSVNQLLDQLANALNTEDKTTILRQQVLDKFNAQEQKWLVRIIFQDLKLGLRHENVLGRFYPNALRRYNECTNLRIVCEEEGLKAELMGVRLFTPFSPMLAKGFPTSNLGQVTTVEAAMKGFPFVMDLKLDGERILCHISDASDSNSFTLYTRRTNDYTDNYWPVVQNIITSIRKKGDFSCILDGEICAFDATTKKYLPFGNNLTVAKAEIEYGETQPEGTADWYLDLPAWMTFIAFDVVYFDGPDSQRFLHQALTECGLGHREVPSGEITNLPLAVRRKLLELIMTPEPDRFVMVPHRVVTSLDVTVRRAAIEDFFNQIVLDAQEGLVVKSLVSPYELGEQSRAFAHWVKMKPEYGDQTEDLDLLVLAGYHGEGSSFRGEGISTFLLGVRTDPGSASAAVYHTLCKVGTGYNFDQLRELRSFLDTIAVPWDEGGGGGGGGENSQGPAHLQHWKIAKKDDRPHVYYPPEKTIAMQIKCAELVESTAFSAGITCRFPRVQRIRYDKGYSDVLTMAEIVAIRNRPRATVQQAADTATGFTKGRGAGRGKKKAATAATTGAAGDTAATPDGAAAKKRPLHDVDDHFQLKRTRVGDANAEIASPALSQSSLLPSSAAAAAAAVVAVAAAPAAPSSLFRGLTFCVLDGEFVDTPLAVPPSSFAPLPRYAESRKYTRDEVMTLIEAHGGALVANASFPTCIVVAPAIGVPLFTTVAYKTIMRKVKKPIALQNLLEQGEKDVLDFRFLLRCIDSHRVYAVRDAAVYLLALSPLTRQQLVDDELQIDVYGDSHIHDAQPVQLRELLLHRLDEFWDVAAKRIQRAETLAKKPPSTTTVAGKKRTAAAAAALKVSESEWRELQDEEKRYIDTLRQCVHDDYDATRDKSWRDVVSQFFDFEDRAPLYAQPCNVLCRDAPLIVYLDLFADVGSMTIPASSSAAAAGAAAFLTWDRDIRSQLDPAWMTALSVDRRDRLLFSMQAALWRLQSYGALVTLHLHSGVTHVVVADGVYDYHRAHSQQQASQGDSHSHSSSQAATVARRAGSQAEKQLYATRWERLQERLRRLRLLDAPDNSHSGFLNKEKRIVPTAWVDRTIARQRALQEAEGSQGTGVITAATYASSSSFV